MIQVGTVLHGTYKLERVLGKGGMGLVYQATHIRLPKQYAIKVMNAEVLANRDAFARFRREAEISSSLGHPNIVEVHDFNETEDGEPYMVMEILNGVDLAEVLGRDGVFATARALRVTRSIVSALAAVHSVGVVHRDLKPQNIFFGLKGGQELVKVLDFGISKISGSSDIHTKTSALMGTPAYMSPEQAKGQSQLVDGRADQFSLGAIVYEMLAGRRAFVSDGDQVMTTLYRILNEDPPPISGYSPAVHQVLLRAMSKEPGERYPDVDAFLSSFEASLEGRPAEGRRSSSTVAPAGVPTRSGHIPSTTSLSAAASEVSKEIVSPPPRRSRLHSTLVAGGAVALVVLGAGALVLINRAGVAANPTFASMDVANPPPANAVVAPAAAVAVVAPPAVPAATKISLRFVVTPPGARVTIDGVPLMSPMVDLQRGSQAAIVHAEADGYESMNLAVPTVKDDTITVALRPLTAAPVKQAQHPLAPSHARPHAKGTNKVDVLEDPYAN